MSRNIRETIASNKIKQIQGQSSLKAFFKPKDVSVDKKLDESQYQQPLMNISNQINEQSTKLDQKYLDSEINVPSQINIEKDEQTDELKQVYQRKDVSFEIDLTNQLELQDKKIKNQWEIDLKQVQQKQGQCEHFIQKTIENHLVCEKNIIKEFSNEQCNEEMRHDNVKFINANELNSIQTTSLLQTKVSSSDMIDDIHIIHDDLTTDREVKDNIKSQYNSIQRQSKESSHSVMKDSYVRDESNNSQVTKKQNEKEAKNMLKLFIKYLEKKKITVYEGGVSNRLVIDSLERILCELRQLKPSCRLEYESLLGGLNLIEEYGTFLQEVGRISKLKQSFEVYIESLKLTRKIKNEIFKQMNNILKEFSFSFELVCSVLSSKLEHYFSRFLKYEQISDKQSVKEEIKHHKINEEENKSNENNSRDHYRCVVYQDQWDKKIQIIPTEEQLDVIVSDTKKDSKIIACAGSGKTTTLVLRIKYLLEHGVKGNQIIVSTFNIEAGKYINQKVLEIIGKEYQQQILIGNIDKIAYKFIRSELEAKQKISKQVLLFSSREYCDIWLSHIKKYRFEYMKYRHFFFDEFQDVSELQYEILMEFKKLNCILTVILCFMSCFSIQGDDAQNIYGFRDTKVDIIQTRIDNDLKKRKKELQEFRLTANHRSSYKITMFASKIIEKDDTLINKSMQSSRKMENQDKKGIANRKGECPHLHIFDSERQQNEMILKRVLSMVMNGVASFKDIAILGPMNEQLKKFEEVIEKHNFKSVESSKIPYKTSIALKFDEFKLGDSLAPQKQDRLTITTIHQSKGLEWNFVFFLGCNDDQFPMAFVERNKNQACAILEEQRRLFYVGTTRAIEELNFCCIVKEPEKMTEMDKKLGRNKVTRFFADIPREFFSADVILDFQEDIMKGYKWIEFEDSSADLLAEGTSELKIKEIIAAMNSKQLDDINLYCQNILEDEFAYNIFGERYDIQQHVKDNQLFSEMGMFFDRCIIRMIGEQYDALNSFYNQVASKVILPVIFELQLPEKLFYAYLCHCKFLSQFSNHELEDVNTILDKFRRECNKEKSKDEVQDMRELICVLSYSAEIQSLKKVQLFHYQKHKQNRYFQDQFERLGWSYIWAMSEYMDRSKKSEDIFESIYKISKCGFLFENRRKYLYSNNLSLILDESLLNNIRRSFIEGFLKRFTHLECKRFYRTKFVSGLIDIIADSNHLIFFRFDIFEQFKKEDLLNYLYAVAYLKVRESIHIKEISIFNFLTGVISSLNLSCWTQHELYFAQIESLAKAQILQNIDKNIQKIIEADKDQVLTKLQKDDLKKYLFDDHAPSIFTHALNLNSTFQLNVWKTKQREIESHVSEKDDTRQMPSNMCNQLEDSKQQSLSEQQKNQLNECDMNQHVHAYVYDTQNIQNLNAAREDNDQDCLGYLIQTPNTQNKEEYKMDLNEEDMVQQQYPLNIQLDSQKDMSISGNTPQVYVGVDISMHLELYEKYQCIYNELDKEKKTPQIKDDEKELKQIDIQFNNDFDVPQEKLIKYTDTQSNNDFEQEIGIQLKNDFDVPLEKLIKYIDLRLNNDFDVPQEIGIQLKNDPEVPQEIDMQFKNFPEVPHEKQIKYIDVQLKKDFNLPQEIGIQLKNDVEVPQEIGIQLKNYVEVPQEIGIQLKNDVEVPQEIGIQLKNEFEVPQEKKEIKQIDIQLKNDLESPTEFENGIDFIDDIDCQEMNQSQNNGLGWYDNHQFDLEQDLENDLRRRWNIYKKDIRNKDNKYLFKRYYSLDENNTPTRLPQVQFGQFNASPSNPIQIQIESATKQPLHPNDFEIDKEDSYIIRKMRILNDKRIINLPN